MKISQPIHADDLRKAYPNSTIGEFCQTVWDLVEANETEIDDLSHVIYPVRDMQFNDTTEIDVLITEMENRYEEN